MIKLPIKIKKCPILEAIFEVRFETNIPDDAVFGIIYNDIKNEYPTLVQLDILQLPAAFRSQDPNLIFKPHYKLQKDKFLVQIGPRVLSVINNAEYVGWSEFSKRILHVYSRLDKLGIIKNINRLALRYVNGFKELDILNNSNLKLLLEKSDFNDGSINTSKINLTSDIEYNKSVSTLRFVNNAKIMIEGKNVSGSVIDIDTSVKFEEFDSVENAIKHAHDVEKQIFFSLLSKTLLQQHEPEYGK